MERRAWGITHDHSDRVNTFLSNTDRNRGVMFPGVDFSRNPNRSSPADDDRIVVDEVDFFSDKNKEKDVNINVKKENSHEEGPKNKLDTALHLLTTNTGSDQSTVDDEISLSSDERDNRARNELVVLKAELERMNAENQRLTDMLSQATNNYNALQLHLMSIMQQQQQQQNLRGINTHEQEREMLKLENKKQEGVNDQIRPRQFMELGPITTETDNDQQSQSSSIERTHSGSQITNQNNTTELVTADHYQRKKNKEIQREEMPGSHETWVSNKVMKVSEPKSVDQATEATMRKVRVSVRARSEAPMITDGCQWRKYGQKMAKGNPCPRAYYRCTMALGCPVRKQVQRCADDKTILITTYEGTHNHPLPPAAMAMASTTSAAANMLLSGSMPSADGLMNPNFLARAILPCSSSVATISASAPFPTVTLDLTHSSNPLQLQRPQTQFNMPIANMGSQDGPVLFGQQLHNLSKFSGLQMSQEMSSAQLGQLVQNHAFNADTLSAATAAIAADPNFTAALAAAIGSIIGRGQQNSNENNNTTSNATATMSNGNKNNIGGFRGN